jgi:hypothetical protein
MSSRLKPSFATLKDRLFGTQVLKHYFLSSRAQRGASGLSGAMNRVPHVFDFAQSVLCLPQCQEVQMNPGSRRCGRIAMGLILGLVLLHGQALGGQTRRHPMNDSLVLERTIGDGDGIELDKPDGLVPLRGRGLALFDWADMQVEAFDAAGQRLWRAGGKGDGPGEFRGGHDVQPDWDGSLHILDKSHLRITVISGNGTVLRSERVGEGIGQLLPSIRGILRAVIPRDTSILWSAVTATGSLLPQVPLPDGVRFHSLLAGESFTATLDSMTAVGYRWSDKIVLLGRDGAVRKVISGIEPIPFPLVVSANIDPTSVENASGARFKTIVVTRIDPKAAHATVDLSGSGDRLYVLFAGRSSEARRIVDVYDIRSGTYIGTYTLPQVQTNIAALGGGRIATLQQDPVPTVKIWRVVPARKPGSK